MRGVIPLRFDEDGPFMELLAIVDGDVAQAIQSCKEEVMAGTVPGEHERRLVRELREAIREVEEECERWGGCFPFDRAAVRSLPLRSDAS